MPKNDDAAVKEREAEQSANEAAVTEQSQETATEETGAVESGEATGSAVGIRSRRGFAMKNLIPDPAWINQNVVAKGKGEKVTVGRVYGIATGFERKANDIQGRLVESIAIKGTFQALSYVTGEIAEATSVFFPMAYAEKIAALMEADPTIKVIECDCDIGLEATGKTIPYEWVVIAFVEGREMDRMRRLRASRPVPADALKHLPKNSALSITDQSNGAPAA